MKIVSNEKLISRNAKIATWSNLIGLALLLAATITAFRSVNLLSLSLALLATGFLLSQIGIHMSSRWARRPRPDELLDKGLKGLDRSYTMYHYTTPVSHLLVGPGGIWVLHPRVTRGTITYNQAKNRWQQKGGNVYLKLFAQEGLGRPDLEIAGEVNALTRFLEKLWEGEEQLSIQATLVFTSDNAQVNAENAPIPTLHLRKLKEFMRKQKKSLAPEVVEKINVIVAQNR